ncbi:MAG: glutaredoxin family protein [Chloroflexota bacterium]
MREFLSGEHIPFVERNIRNDPGARQELLRRFGEVLVPVLLVDDRWVIGWDPERIRSILGLPAA